MIIIRYKKHSYKPRSLQLTPTNPSLASHDRHPPAHDKEQSWQCGLRHTFIPKGLKMSHRKLSGLQEMNEVPLKSGREKGHCWAPSLEDTFIQRKMPCRDTQDSQKTRNTQHCVSPRPEQTAGPVPQERKLQVGVADAYRRKDGCSQKGREHHLMWACKWLPLIFLLKGPTHSRYH